ncbi:MAG: PVC-type heme-binding CxxCH protein [Isosphaeraceae bacterium]
MSALPRGPLRTATLLGGLCLILATPLQAFGALPKVPEGFKIRLVAAVPAVQYPCQVATAPDGALFVAEDPMDQIGPADRPIDRILLFREGRDPVVFAEKLNAVFGMVWHQGALYVMNMPHLTVLRDTDGDDQADSREELFTDLGVPAGQPNMFNDHIVSGLQIGIDGFLYISVGDKGVPRATGVDGRTATIRGGGVLRCRLDGRGLEIVSTGTRNHLEPNLDDRDNLFTYDNTDDGLGWWTRVTHHIDGGYHGYPWDYHDREDRMLDRMAEYGGGSPCGGFVYREDVWPEKYRGRAFWAEWAKRVVRGIAFRPDGASFAVKDFEDFIEPDAVSDFRPLDLALSHDGRTMYVADWGYGGWNNKTEKLGRVYAVTFTGDVDTRPRGSDADPIAAQIQALDHPSFNERFRAQGALAARGGEAIGLVTAALADSKTPPVAKRHLVWALDAIAGGTPEATIPLVDALGDPTPDVRAQAARALGIRAVPLAADRLATLLDDPEPSVRLQATIALGRIGLPESIAAIIPGVADRDPYLAFASRTALRRIGDWTTVAKGLDHAEPKVRLGVIATMEMAYDADAASALARFASDPKRDPAERASALFTLAQGHRRPIPWDGKWWGTQPAKTRPPAKTIDWPGTPLVLDAVRARLDDPQPLVRLAAVNAVIDERDQDALASLRAKFPGEKDPPVRLAAARAFGELKDREAVPLLTAALREPSATDAIQDAALASLEAIGDPAALNALLGVLKEGTLGEDRQSRVVTALGRFSSADAINALVEATSSPSVAVRAAAAGALGTAGRGDVASPPLRALLDDPAVEVRKAAIGALGAQRDRLAIPGLLNAADTLETRFEATLALAAVPDARAVRVYLRGLTDKSGEVRRATAAALTTVRDEAAPLLEELAGRNELPPSALDELRRVYTAARPIRSWRILGPFPIKDEPPFPVEGNVDLSRTYPGFQDAPLTRNVMASGRRGMVDLEKAIRGASDVAAFGYAEVTSPADRKAEFVVGSDDTLTVWVNGEKVFDFQDNRGFTPDANRFDVALNQGVNRVLVKCGNTGGAWQFAVAVGVTTDHAFLKGPASGAFDPDAFRAFAMRTAGNPERGRALFHDLKGLACVKCHAVAGGGGTVGPDLTGVGVKYPREELAESVLYPSAKILSGYEPVVLATLDGRVLTGIVKGENPDSIEIEDADAKRHRLPKSEIEERKTSAVSLMPNGLAEGLSREDFADLLAYLESLKEAGPR